MIDVAGMLGLGEEDDDEVVGVGEEEGSRAAGVHADDETSDVDDVARRQRGWLGAQGLGGFGGGGDHGDEENSLNGGRISSTSLGRISAALSMAAAADEKLFGLHHTHHSQAGAGGAGGSEDEGEEEEKESENHHQQKQKGGRGGRNHSTDEDNVADASANEISVDSALSLSPGLDGISQDHGPGSPHLLAGVGQLPSGVLHAQPHAFAGAFDPIGSC
jgi:hypothetical protein